MKKIQCDIRKILGELSEVNSRNEQKVLAIASWNKRGDTINIRRYNTEDEILLNGISLTFEEAEKLLYSLLESLDINYDTERVSNIIKDRVSKVIDIEKLVEEDESVGEYKRTDKGTIPIEPKD